MDRPIPEAQLVRVLLLGSGVLLAAFLAGPISSAQGSSSSGAAPGVKPAVAPAAGPVTRAAASTPAGAPQDHGALLKTYCVTCHNDRTKSGELSLEQMNVADVPKSAETWEKVIRKVRAGMMPPAGMPRPEPARLNGFVTYLETSIDRAAAANPRPGRTSLHRLNRAEYANAIRDLLGLEVDVTSLLPPDDESSGFDNIADVLTVSP